MIARAFLCLLLLLWVAGVGKAQDLASLDKQIVSVESDLKELTKQYEQRKTNIDEALAKIDQEKSAGNAQAADSQTKAVYTATEQLNQMLARMNELKDRRSRLCDEWRASYRKTVDELLQTAEKEKEKGRKAEIGKLLQK